MDSYRVLLRYALAHLARLYSIEGRLQDLSVESYLEPVDHVKFNSMKRNAAAKIIKTKYGEEYECVELSKQPAFDHTLLKNHQIQMRPSFDPQKETATSAIGNGSFSETSTNVGFSDGCPLGTVPIRRRSRAELVTAEAAFRQLVHSFHTSTENSLLVFAGIATEKKESTVYHGAGGFVSINSPTVDYGQCSSSVISIEAGSKNDFSVIRVGWMVNVDMYHDNRTRMYILWGQGKNGEMHCCLNTYCAGFIQTDASIALDMILEPVSVTRGPQFYIKFAVTQDKNTGNWWLVYGDNDKPVGYWPSKLFANLQNGAETLRWGGLVYSSTPQLPQMGNGDNGELHSSHFRQVAIKYEAGSSLNGSVDVPLGAVQTPCYKAGDNSYKSEFWGYSFYFGGNGGDVFQCYKV